VHANVSPESVVVRAPTCDGSHGAPAVNRFFPDTVLDVDAVDAVDALVGGAVVLDVPDPLATLVAVVDDPPVPPVPAAAPEPP
jgi:hypothetical protein